MALTDLTVRLLLIFFPGIICFFIMDAFIVHRDRKAHEILLFSYIYGILSYLIYGLFFIPLRMMTTSVKPGINAPWDLSVFKWLSDPKAQLDVLEIVCASIIGVVLAFILSFCVKKKFLHTIAQRFGVTNKFAETDVWNFSFNMDDARWCVVRDMPNNLMFQGYAQAFSDVGEFSELLLTQVSVYDEKTAELRYEADRIYLARKKDDWTIQFQNLPQGEGTSNAEQNYKARTDDGQADSANAGGNGTEGRAEPAEHDCGSPR
jgi:putative flippase GtrA